MTYSSVNFRLGPTNGSDRYCGQRSISKSASSAVISKSVPSAARGFSHMSKFVRDAVTYPNPADLMPSLRIEYFIYIIIIFLYLVFSLVTI